MLRNLPRVEPTQKNPTQPHAKNMLRNLPPFQKNPAEIDTSVTSDVDVELVLLGKFNTKFFE